MNKRTPIFKQDELHKLENDILKATDKVFRDMLEAQKLNELPEFMKRTGIVKQIKNSKNT